MPPFSSARRLATLMAGLLILSACSPKPESPPAATTRPVASELPPLTLDRFDPVVREQLERQRGRLRAVRDSGARGKPLGEAYGALGMLYQSHQLLPSALACYEHAGALDPGELRWAYFQGQSLLTEGQLDEAARAFERALTIAPEDLPARLALGRTLQASGRLPEARRELEGVLAQEPGSVLALFHLSQVASEQGRHEEAIDLAERALRLQPQAEPIVRVLVGLYGRQGERAKAEALARSKASEAIVVTDPLMSQLAALADSGRAWVDRGVAAFLERRWADAEAAFREALARQPDDAEAHLNLGSALYQQQRVEAAEAEYRRALELEPESVKGHFNLGTLLSARGQREQAVAAFEAALRGDPGDLAARFNMANSLLALGRFEGAEAAFAAVVAADPARSPARLGQSVALIQLGREAEARRVLEEGLAGKPNDLTLLHGLARLLAASSAGEVRDGKKAVALATRIAGANSQVEHALALAMASAEVGDFAQALDLQRRSLAAVQKAGRGDLVPSIEANLALYEAGKPCRTPWTGAEFGGKWK